MAIDNTPPRLKLIVTIAVITVVTLVSLDFVFKSYYGMMTDEAQHEKVAPTTERDNLHKAEQAALTSANIDQAMKSVAAGTRPESITPQPSEDMGPMTGWSKLPKAAPTPVPHDATPTMAGDAGVTGDGGAMMAGDGGVMLAGDAGAAGKGDGGLPLPKNEQRHGGGAH